MSESPSDERLRELLHSADPAGDGHEPDAEERAALRRLTLSKIPERTTGWRWLPAAAAVAAMLVAAVVVLGPEPAPVPTGAPATARTGTGAPDDADPGDRRQQVQFATENGTRIIWVLDPDLTL